MADLACVWFELPVATDSNLNAVLLDVLRYLLEQGAERDKPMNGAAQLLFILLQEKVTKRWCNICSTLERTRTSQIIAEKLRFNLLLRMGTWTSCAF